MGSSSYTTTTLGKYLPPPSTPREQDESQGPTCFPSERVGGDASRVLGSRWWSSHTHFCLRWPLMFLSFGSMCSVPAASSFLGPPLARPRGPQVKNRQTYRRLTGSRQTSTLPFFLKLLKLKELLTYSISLVKRLHAHYINISGPFPVLLKNILVFFQSQGNMKIQSKTTGEKAVL